MRILRQLSVLLGALIVPLSAAAQRTPARFEIAAVTDSTLSFRTAGASWVRIGVSGIAVDPRRRDQLVARFKVIAVTDGVANALITGQTTDVSTDHVATAVEPPVPWFKRGSFWLGLFLGGAIGAVAGAAS